MYNISKNCFSLNIHIVFRDELCFSSEKLCFSIEKHCLLSKNTLSPINSVFRSKKTVFHLKNTVYREKNLVFRVTKTRVPGIKKTLLFDLINTVYQLIN